MAAEVISIYTTMLEGICFLREIPEKAFGSDQKAGKRGGAVPSARWRPRPNLAALHPGRGAKAEAKGRISLSLPLRIQAI
jgi:hypothetical protein